MGLINTFTLASIEPTKSGDLNFFTPQSSNETILVEVPPNTQEDLFVHRFQTDQLFVVKGSMVMVLLQNNRYEYVLLSDRIRQTLIIPPGIPHGVINLSAETCLVINALLRHGDPHKLDYRPRKPPFDYDLTQVKKKLLQLESENTVAVRGCKG